MALHFSLLITRQPWFKVISIDIFHNKRGNCFVRTDPYAHPQHMEIVKQLICVWHWYVSHLELVYSLNVNTTTLWFAPRKTPRILVNVQTLLADKNDSSMVRTHPHAHPQHMKVVRHHICAWYWCGSRFEWVYSLKDVLKLRLWFAPQKATRILNSKWFYNESCGIVVRTHPYTHPQHLKVEHTLYAFDIDVWAILNGSIASISQSLHIIL